MFVDYYAVLEIHSTASQDVIKAAFKKQALKWHPDRNHGQDTTFRMQQINEAYIILKDQEARQRYDKECIKFKQYQQQKEYSKKAEQRKKTKEQHSKEKQTYKENKYDKKHEYKEYTVNDDILGKWMENARKQAVDLAKKTIVDFKEISSAGAKAVANEAVVGLGRYIIFSITIFIVFALIKTCNG